ncbi:hypothetical protein FPZ12_000035 [Amycolatopsis acidicola]|uniref:DUF320 domain-containing protein n=1 Tax=Amycolatopsis acidicola TaxID=2596893 RepID=A0A5N0VMZ1_9PSEU|nr:hypothetical protein [Amycolatopsis acidicola]KAA9166654.1 hypothetical protein FPZ12_000035 [Amycolatopsis acidicola]
MQDRTRKAAAVGATAFILAGSAVLATSGTASAATPASTSTVSAKCGDTVTVHPGDVLSTPLGLKTVTDGLTSIVGGLLTGLCQITVNVVDTVVAPVPVVGAPVAGAVDNAVKGTTNGVTGAVQQATGSGGNKQQPAPQNPPSNGGSPQTGPSGGNGNAGTPATIPGSTSPVLGGDPSTFALLPFGSSGYAPMRDYSDIPYALAGLWAPSPGVRYGGQIPGYAPEVGALGDSGSKGNSSVQNAGQAEALPGTAGGAPGPLGLPMLIAVLSLSGVSAALVRTWVLRGATR